MKDLDFKDYKNLEKNFARKMVKDTEHYQRKYGFDSGKSNSSWNNEADAFKHTYMQVWLSIYATKPIAKYFGDEHERKGNAKGQPLGEENMDLWNNQQGREIAEELRQEFGGSLKNIFNDDAISDIIADRVMKRMRAGRLITSPNDKRQFFEKVNGQSTGYAAKIENLERIFTAEEIGNMSDDEFSLYEPIINNQINNYGVPQKAQAQESIASGDMIWVEGYVRLDGTEVCGYFRRK